MADYSAARASFSWEAAALALDGLPGGRGLNIAHEAVDRHAAGPRRDTVALRCVDRRGGHTTVTYGELAGRSARFANVLAELGVAPGERVFSLLPRTADVHTVAMGTFKHRAVLAPSFAAFGPEPIRHRLELASARVLVTTSALYRRTIAPMLDSLAGLHHVLLVDGDDADASARRGRGADVRALPQLMAVASDQYEIGPTDPEDMALVHFTSGTTGTPKGAIHVHRAVLSHYVTGRLALDLHPDDVLWCTADPGSVTGMSYGVVSPLTHGVTTVVDEGDVDAARWYELLEREQVTVWYTGPTALRVLVQAGPRLPARYDLSRLRFIASVGEPLNPEIVVWAHDVLGLAVHDNWWQTETGGIMIANVPCMDVKPGSMGKPLPGVEATVLRTDEQGEVLVGHDGQALEAPVGQQGELALRPGWPSMFRGYLGDKARYGARFRGGWYLTGDLVRRDEDGYFWFVGRTDDVVVSGGQLIGPFEVESVLLEHPAVAEAAVIGKPDAVAGEVVKAFVALRHGVLPSPELRLELMALARRRLGAAVAPREIEFRPALPHTQSGTIMRRLLKAEELGVASGDVSTAEATR